MSPLTLRLKELRAARGLTQVALANKADVRRATISRIENGLSTAVDFDVLERLADALEADPGSLIVRTPKVDWTAVQSRDRQPFKKR